MRLQSKGNFFRKNGEQTAGRSLFAVNKNMEFFSVPLTFLFTAGSEPPVAFA